MTAQKGYVPHIARLGKGARKVLALHCTMAFSGAWAGLGSSMGAGFGFVAPDMPSHGRSPDWDGLSSFADTVYAGALAALDGEVDVIGHSFGGAIALRLAAERPEFVRSVTMIEPVFFHIAKLDAPASLVEHDEILNPFYEALAGGDRETAARVFNRMWSDGPKWPDLPERLRAAMVRAIHVVPDTQPFLYDDSAGLMPRLDQIAAPALLIHGETSLDVVKTTNAGLARRLKNCAQAEIPGAGHMVPVSHPQEVAKVLAGFLAQVPEAA